MWKHVVWAVAVPSLSLWLVANPARACDPATEGGEHEVIISMVGAGGEPVVLAGDGATPGCTKVMRVVAAPGAAAAGGKGDSRFVTLTGTGTGTGQWTAVEGTPAAFAGMMVSGEPDEDAKNRGWLGVQIGSVPESLSDQLGLAGKGTMVLNVVENSPAAKAGIEQHDVVVAINGNEIEGGVEKFVEAVRGQKPGDRVDIKVLRNGKAMNFAGVELAARESNQFKWMFDFSPMAEVEEHISTRGRVILKDENGNWVVKDLGDVDSLPADIAQMMPQAEHRAMVFVDAADGGKKTVKITVNRNGETTQIAREDGGEIKVTRTDKAGTVTEDTYANEDELKAADEDAFDLLDGHNGQVRINFAPGAVSLPEFNINIEELQDGLAEVHVDVQKSLSDAHKAYEEAMVQLKNLNVDVPQFNGTMRVQPLSSTSLAHSFMVGKPKHAFELQPDGRIDVRIRKGDSELVQKFTSEQDLQTRDPQLYAKFQELMQADRE